MRAPAIAATITDVPAHPMLIPKTRAAAEGKVLESEGATVCTTTTVLDAPLGFVSPFARPPTAGVVEGVVAPPFAAAGVGVDFAVVALSLLVEDGVAAALDVADVEDD